MAVNWFLRRWRIARVPRFAAHLFAHRFVTVPAANKVRKSRAVRTRSIVLRLRQAHRNWVMRLKELTQRELWSPTFAPPGGDAEAFSVMRCIGCRPTSVEYRWNTPEPQLKFCGRASICPFCYARKAEDFYRRLIRGAQQLRKTESKLIIACRIVTYTINAQHFFVENGGGSVFSDVPRLQNALTVEIQNYKKIRRKLARNTFGSAWRVIVNPVGAGWEIQVRQLFVTRPRARRPVNRPKKSARIFLQSAKLTDINAAVDVLGTFIEYPRGLLTGYAELTATTLHARAGLRLSNATGIFYKRNTPRKSQEAPKYLPDVP